MRAVTGRRQGRARVEKEEGTSPRRRHLHGFRAAEMLLAGENVHRRGGRLLPFRKIPEGRSLVPKGRSMLAVGEMWRDRAREVRGDQTMKYLPPEIRNLADSQETEGSPEPFL